MAKTSSATKSPPQPTLSVIGLGKLGSPAAAVFASKGFTVIGVDLNPKFVDAINRGEAPVEEPQLADLIKANRKRLSATTSIAEAVQKSDYTFIIVPTPSQADGMFTNKYVVDAVSAIGAALRKKTSRHVVVVCSTVMPGSTGGVIQDTLEAASGKNIGPKLGLAYNPEFIALGSVVRDMLNPDIILIGESDEKTGADLAAIYQKTCANKPAICRMNFVNAELTKISINTYVTTKISYANMLAGLCESLPGADVDVVSSAVGGDSRVGRKYLKGAMGYAGPCFPRDNVAWASLAKKMGVRADLAVATDSLNAHQVERLTERVKANAKKGATVAILGLAYKPNTPVIEQSQSVMLAQSLVKLGYKIVVHDSHALEAARAVLGTKVSYAAKAAEALKAADVAVVAVGDEDYKKLQPAAFKKTSGRMVVIDAWRCLAQGVSKVADVLYIGCGPDLASAKIGNKRRVG